MMTNKRTDSSLMREVAELLGYQIMPYDGDNPYSSSMVKVIDPAGETLINRSDNRPTEWVHPDNLHRVIPNWPNKIGLAIELCIEVLDRANDARIDRGLIWRFEMDDERVFFKQRTLTFGTNKVDDPSFQSYWVEARNARGMTELACDVLKTIKRTGIA